MASLNEQIGYVVGGGLREGLRVRLTVPADEVQEGSSVVCDSGRWRFYGLLTDMQLGATDPVLPLIFNNLSPWILGHYQPLNQLIIINMHIINKPIDTLLTTQRLRFNQTPKRRPRQLTHSTADSKPGRTCAQHPSNL